MAKSKSKSKSPGTVYDSDGTTPLNYIVIIDAGSGGSRVHVYSYPDTKYRLGVGNATDPGPGPGPGALTLPLITKQSHKWHKKVTPGLHMFAKAPGSIGRAHLRPLLAYAQQIVPASQHYRTPVFLHATGGVRLLKPAQSAKVLAECCEYLQAQTQFFLPACQSHVSTVDGAVEGIFGWTAVNYLAGNLKDPAKHEHGNDENSHFTYGFLDMGGASTQITFVPNSTETQAHKQQLYTVNIPSLKGDADLSFQVSSTSYLGFGVNEAHKQVLQGLIESSSSSGSNGNNQGTKDDKGAIEDPCTPIGLHTIYDTKEKSILSIDIVQSGRSGNNKDGSDTDTDNDSDDEKKKNGNKSGHRLKKKLKKKLLFKRDDALKTRNTPNTQLFLGTGNFTQCQSSMLPLVEKMNSVSKPQLDFDINHFVGVSEYWDTTHEAFEMDKGTAGSKDQVGNAFDLTKHKHRVSQYCATQFQETQKDYKKAGRYSALEENELKDLCFRASWILSVLEHGVKVNGSSSIDGTDNDLLDFSNTFQSINRLDNMKYSWTLGRALLYAAGEQSLSKNAKYSGLLFNGNSDSDSDSNSDSGKDPKKDPSLANPRRYRYGGGDPFAPRPVFNSNTTNLPNGSSGSNGKWDDFLKAHSQRMWASIAFLSILVIVFYLLLGRMRRKQIWQSVRTYVPFANRHGHHNHNGFGRGLDTIKGSTVGVFVGSLLSKLPFVNKLSMYQGLGSSSGGSGSVRKYQKMNSEPVEDLELGVIDHSSSGGGRGAGGEGSLFVAGDALETEFGISSDSEEEGDDDNEQVSGVGNGNGNGNGTETSRM